VGTPLALQREPDNTLDALAIEVFWLAVAGERVKLGYVPRKHNLVLARLMDAGKELTARLSRVDDPSLWQGLRMEIHSRDW
jgi:hypothetical protein